VLNAKTISVKSLVALKGEVVLRLLKRVTY
jgi:hypothetical protein